MGARHLEAQIGRQHAPGRQHRGDPRHDDPREVELAGDLGRVQPRGAAKGEQREAPRVDAAPHRDQPHPLGHVGVDDAMDAVRRGQPIDAERCGDAVDRRLGRAPVEPAPPAEKARRVEIAQHQVGVGDRRLGAALAVAGRARNRTGARRADMQDAALVDPRDRAAAGADAGDVEAVERDRVAGDAAVRWPGPAAPSTISEMSVLVPPMSNGIRLPSPTSRAAWTLPATPPAGPDSTAPAASRPASAIGATPPCDWMIRVGPHTRLRRAALRGGRDSAPRPARHRR